MRLDRKQDRKEDEDKIMFFSDVQDKIIVFFNPVKLWWTR